MMKWKLPKKYFNANEEESAVTEIKITDKDQSASFTANRLYFYGEITNDSVINWNKQLDDISRNLRIVQVLYDLPKVPVINIYLQSTGGEIFSALSVLGKMESLIKDGYEINTIIEGFCASGATLVSIGGTERYMRRHSCMLIHQLSSSFWGTYKEFQDEQKNIELMMGIIKDIYHEYTSVDNTYLNSILEHDLYLTPGECLEKGLIDKII